MTAEPVAEDTTPGLPPTATLLGSAAPSIVFLVMNSVLGLRYAIGGATVATIGLAVARRRSGLPLGRFWPAVNAYVILRGALGIFFDSDAVYFGIGIGTKFAFGVGLIVSAFIGRPVVGELMPNVLRFPRLVVRHPVFRTTMVHLTILWAAFQILSAVWDIWLFQNSSTNGYVAIRLGVNWVMGMVIFGGAFVYADKRLQRIPGFGGLIPLFEDMANTTFNISSVDDD